MLENIRDIFRIYGGWKAVCLSSYVRWALFFSLLLWRDALNEQWSANIATYLPPVLGFSFAALAIMTAIGDDRFREYMANVESIQEGYSDLTVITANFCWFILVQVAAVILALSFSAKPVPDVCQLNSIKFDCPAYVEWGHGILGLLGNFLLIYSLVLIIAAVSQMMSVFRLYLSSMKYDGSDD